MPPAPRERTPFLPSDPPHWAARGLAYLLLGVFAAAIVLAIAVRVPETVASPFVLQPVRGADPVRASRSGTVVAVRAAEGQAIAKGDLLFVIRSTPVGEQSADLRSYETQAAGTAASLANLRREQESQQRADREDDERLQLRLAYLTKAIDSKKQQLALLKQVADRFELLHKEGLVGWTETAERQLEIGKAAAEQEAFENDLEEARKSLDKLRHESAARVVKFQEDERRLTEDGEKARIRIAALQKELVHSQTDELSVLAPCDGTLLRLRVNAPGAYVPEGEILSDLACGGERLQAELTVPQSGMGRLRPGQSVKLLYEAFPYQRYGVQYGTVRWVSPATLAVDSGAGFRAFVDLDDDAVVVDGEARALKPGMRGTARVVVERPRLITYAFEPLRQLRENLAAAPAARRRVAE